MHVSSSSGAQTLFQSSWCPSVTALLHANSFQLSWTRDTSSILLFSFPVPPPQDRQNTPIYALLHLRQANRVHLGKSCAHRAGGISF